MIRLKQIRNKKGLTQKKLSLMSGISQHYISEIENGNRVGTLKTLTRLAGTLEVSINELINKSDAAEKNVNTKTA